MTKPIFDLNDSDFIFFTSDTMGMDSDGNMMRISDNMAMDMDSGELYMDSLWKQREDEDN